MKMIYHLMLSCMLLMNKTKKYGNNTPKKSGEKMIPYDKARMLAKIYGVTMEELYEEKENQPE